MQRAAAGLSSAGWIGCVLATPVADTPANFNSFTDNNVGTLESVLFITDNTGGIADIPPLYVSVNGSEPTLVNAGPGSPYLLQSGPLNPGQIRTTIINAQGNIDYNYAPNMYCTAQSRQSKGRMIPAELVMVAAVLFTLVVMISMYALIR
jgi:hypothetical protein